MHLINYTEIPDDTLRGMIRFALPSGVANFDITFKNDGSGSLHGYCYHAGTSYHIRNGKCPPLVTIHVPKGWKKLTKRNVTRRDSRVDMTPGRPVRFSRGRVT